MLQDIRQNINGPGAKIIIGLIVVAFAFFGIESVLFGGGGSEVAQVNGEDITPQELQQAVNSQKRRMMAMMGDNLDPAMLDDALISPRVLEGLIDRKLLMQTAEGMKLAVSDRELGRIIAGMEQFQIDGAFSPELYKSSLANSGYTPLSFKQALRDDLLVTQLRSGLAGSDFATPAELELSARVAGEQRDLRFLTIPLDDFLDNVEISEEDIQAFYSENESMFLRSESVDLDFIELRVDDFREPVEESLLREEYELEKDSFGLSTRHRVSHILFEEGGEQSVAERIAQAQAALAQGREFADVAAEFSDDIGSSGAGGDLGYTTGDAFPEEMEEAIAALALDSVSAPVATDAGTHLILVTDREEGNAPSFEDVRGELEENLQLSEARVQMLRSVETLKDLVFIAEDLEGPAEDLDLTVQQANEVTRSNPEGLFANPSLVSAAFSEDVLSQGHNSEVIELAGDHWVVLRVRKHTPAAPRPLEEVRGEVLAAISEARAREAATQAGQAALASLRAGTSVEQYANDNGFAWQVELAAQRVNPVVPRSVLQRAFQLPAPDDGSSLFELVTAPTGDVQVFELSRVQPGNYAALDENARSRMKQQLSGEYGALVDGEFQRGLRDGADITVL